MSKIEERIDALVNQVKTEHALCCRLFSVNDLAEKAYTVRVHMLCTVHQPYLFDVQYADPDSALDEQTDEVLKQRIRAGIRINTRN